MKRTTIALRAVVALLPLLPPSTVIALAVLLGATARGGRMIAGYALAIKRLYGTGIVRVAAKHNLREIAAEIGVDGHIDAARIADNFTLRGPATADGVARLAKSLMDAAGATKFRKTSVMALELVFMLPEATTINPRQYFEQATRWAEQHFGVPVLSCVAHMDEGAPHAHALLLPLVDGRMGGSDLHGGKAKLWAMQTSFHEQVGAHYGLARQSSQKRHSATVRAAAMALLLECFQTNTAMTDAAIQVLLKPHAKDPEPLLLALGFAMPAPKAKAKDSFVTIMTKACKPEPRNPIGKARHNPIGKAAHDAAPESQPYTCVGIAFPTASFPAKSDEQPSASITGHQQAATQPSAANVQQASSGPAAQQLRPASGADDDHGANLAPARDQQQERSTAGGLLSFQDTPLVVTTNPADGQTASNSTSQPRKRATKPQLAALTLVTDGATGTVPAVAQVDRQDGKPALQQAGHEQDARDRAAADEQAGKNTSSGVGPAINAPKKRATVRGQNGTGPLQTGRSTPASSSTEKRKRTASKVARTAQTTTTATAQHQPASAHASEIYEACPSAPVTSTADQVSAAPSTAKTPERAGKPASASPAAAKRKPAASKRVKGARATAPTSTPAAPAKAASSKRSGRPALTATTSTPTSITTMASAQADKLPLEGELRPLPEAPSTAPTTVPSATSPAACRRTADGTADQPDEIRRLGNHARAKDVPASSSSCSVSLERDTMPAAKVAPADELHQDAMGAPATSGCTAPASANIGGHLLQAHHATTGPEQHPAPAHSPDERATARLMPPAPDAEHDRHQHLVKPERAPDLCPLEGEQRQADADGGYQREREQDRPAETCDVDRGEFIAALAITPGRRAAAHRGWGADAPGNAPSMLQALLDDRPSPADVALASIRAVHGWH